MDDIKKIKHYLEGAKNIEASAFTQKTIIHKLQDEVNSMDFRKKEFYKPYLQKKRPAIHSAGEFLKIVLKSFIIPLFIFIAWLYPIATTDKLTTKATFIFNCILTLAATAVITFLVISKKCAAVSSEYAKNKKRYEEEMKKYEDDIQAEEARLKSLNDKKDYIISQGRELVSGYNNTKSSLKQYYNSCSLIYPKYHNMIAVTQILEYLDSGRCSCLTGPDGAYNLYESELRMNQIIGNLDLIVDSLEQIKTTQFMMYRELQKANDIAERIAQSVDDAASSLASIHRSSAVTAYNSQVMAANSEIIARHTYY